MTEHFDLTPQRLRHVLGHFASGLTVITAATHDGPAGFMIAACAVIFVPLGGGRDAFHRAIKIAIVLGFFALLYKDTLPTVLKRALGPLDAALSNRFSRWIGDLSYGGYLIHLLVMLPVCGWLARAYPALAPFPRFSTALVLTIAITYGLAWLAYRFIELPGITLGRQVAGRFQKTKPALASA